MKALLIATILLLAACTAAPKAAEPMGTAPPTEMVSDEELPVEQAEEQKAAPAKRAVQLDCNTILPNKELSDACPAVREEEYFVSPSETGCDLLKGYGVFSIWISRPAEGGQQGVQSMMAATLGMDKKPDEYDIGTTAYYSNTPVGIPHFWFAKKEWFVDMGTNAVIPDVCKPEELLKVAQILYARLP